MRNNYLTDKKQKEISEELLRQTKVINIEKQKMVKIRTDLMEQGNHIKDLEEQFIAYLREYKNGLSYRRFLKLTNDISEHLGISKDVMKNYRSKI